MIAFGLLDQVGKAGAQRLVFSCQFRLRGRLARGFLRDLHRPADIHY
jgi:hypothetical protein